MARLNRWGLPEHRAQAPTYTMNNDSLSVQRRSEQNFFNGVAPRDALAWERAAYRADYEQNHQMKLFAEAERHIQEEHLKVILTERDFEDHAANKAFRDIAIEHVHNDPEECCVTRNEQTYHGYQGTFLSHPDFGPQPIHESRWANSGPRHRDYTLNDTHYRVHGVQPQLESGQIADAIAVHQRFRSHAIGPPQPRFDAEVMQRQRQWTSGKFTKDEWRAKYGTMDGFDAYDKSMEHPHYYTGSHVQQSTVKDHLGHWRTDEERQRLKNEAAEAHFRKREAEKEQYNKMRERLAAETGKRIKIGWDTPQVFECVIPHPGVGYRNSVDFNDKNPDNKGPKCTSSTGESMQKCVIGTEFQKGPTGVLFLKCTTGRGWLPMTNVKGDVQCFKHLGPVSEVQTKDLRMQSPIDLN